MRSEADRSRRYRSILPFTLLASIIASANGAVGQVDSPKTTPTLRLIQQTGLLDTAGQFRIDAELTGDVPSNATVAVTVYARLRDTENVARMIQAQRFGSVVGFAKSNLRDVGTPRLGQLAPTTRSVVVEVFSQSNPQCIPTSIVSSPSSPSSVPSPSLPSPSGGLRTCAEILADGVYPVRLEVRNETDESAVDLTTFITRITGPVREPLQVATIVPLHAGPSIQPDGNEGDPDLQDFIQKVEGLATHPLVPVTLLPTPETVDALRRSDRGGVLDTLRTALSGREVVSGPYVRLPTAVLDDADRTIDVTQQYAVGSLVLRRALNLTPDTQTLILGAGEPLPGSRVFQQLNVKRLVALDPLFSGQAIKSGHPFLYDPGSTEGTDVLPISTMSIDPALQANLDGVDRVLAVHHLLADLALRYFSQPDQPHAIVLELGRTDLTRDAFDELISDLGSNPLFKPILLSQAFDLSLATNNNELLYRAAKQPTGIVSEKLTPSAARIDAARNRVLGYASLFENRSTATGDALDRRLLTASSLDLPAEGSNSGDKFIDGINRALDVELTRVTIPERRRFTVTAATASVVIIMQSAMDEPIRVRLTVSGDRIGFPVNTNRICLNQKVGVGRRSCEVVLRERSTFLKVPITTRSSGTSTLLVELATPSGTVLANTRYTVRSFAASGVGVGLTVGAIAILATWWARLVRRRRKTS